MTAGQTPEEHSALESLVTALAENSQALAATADRITKLIEGERESRRRRGLWIAAALVVLIASVGGSIAVSLGNRSITRSIESCTNPKGACAQRQAQSTSQLVGQPEGPINTVAFATAVCAVLNDGVEDATLDCTRRIVAKLTPAPQRSGR